MTTTPNPRGDAGYSGTPLPRKLGIGPGSRVVVLDAPTRLDLGVEVTTDLEGGPFDVLLLFCPDAARMAAVLPPAMAAHGSRRPVLGRLAEAGVEGADRPHRGRRPSRRARGRLGGCEGRGRRSRMVGSVPDAPHERVVEVIAMDEGL